MLYIVRHADAVDREDDASRELSGTGRAQAERLGLFLRESRAMAPKEAWHSPLVRARETAEIVGQALGWKIPLQKVDGLRPDDRPTIAADKIAAARHDLAIFGHNPHLSLLATLLVTGEVEPPAFLLRKCSVVALEPARGRAPGDWAIAWHIAPELLVDER
jgi:phosphohistidine phosphatase